MWLTTAQKFAQSSQQMKGWTKNVLNVSSEMLNVFKILKNIDNIDNKLIFNILSLYIKKL